MLDNRVGEIAKRLPYIGSVGGGLQLDYLADYMEKMAAALLRRYELLDPVTEKQGSDLVVVDDRREAEDCSDFRDEVPLRLGSRTEKAGTADVYQEDHGHLPLLLVHLHIGRAQAGGHIPVHRARIVPILVLTHLAESHAAPFEGAVILSGKDLVRQGPGTDLYLPDLTEEFVG